MSMKIEFKSKHDPSPDNYHDSDDHEDYEDSLNKIEVNEYEDEAEDEYYTNANGLMMTAAAATIDTTEEEREESSDAELGGYDYDIDKKIELVQESSNLKLKQYHSKAKASLVVPNSNISECRELELEQQMLTKRNIVHEILCEQDLSRAGCLFSFSNELLLKDFSTTITIIKSIIDNKSYLENLNEQSIVEIVLTKCISALR